MDSRTIVKLNWLNNDLRRLIRFVDHWPAGSAKQRGILRKIDAIKLEIAKLKEDANV